MTESFSLGNLEWSILAMVAEELKTGQRPGAILVFGVPAEVGALALGSIIETEPTKEGHEL